MAAGLRLGLPGEEDDLFEKLEQAGSLSFSMVEILKRMKALRNILVHEYGRIDNRIVYEVVENKLHDFQKFKQEVLDGLSQH
jgi:uncharacterized protein YutE (UPF0331/DUF86 family)